MESTRTRPSPVRASTSAPNSCGTSTPDVAVAGGHFPRGVGPAAGTRRHLDRPVLSLHLEARQYSVESDHAVARANLDLPVHFCPITSPSPVRATSVPATSSTRILPSSVSRSSVPVTRRIEIDPSAAARHNCCLQRNRHDEVRARRASHAGGLERRRLLHVDGDPLPSRAALTWIRVHGRLIRPTFSTSTTTSLPVPAADLDRTVECRDSRVAPRR